MPYRPRETFASAYIHVTLPPPWVGPLNRMAGPKGRSTLIRRLVAEDVRDIVKNGAGLTDDHLRVYYVRTGKRVKRHPRVPVRVTPDWYRVVKARAGSLHFSIDEYVFALLVREWHRQSGQTSPRLQDKK